MGRYRVNAGAPLIANDVEEFDYNWGCVYEIVLAQGCAGIDSWCKITRNKVDFFIFDQPREIPTLDIGYPG